MRTIGLHAHHYFRGDRKGLNQGFEVWEMLHGASAEPWSLDWQTDGTTRTIQPTLFDWITLYLK